MSRRISIGLKALLFALVLLIPAVIFPMQADAATPTTSLTIKKLAVDGTTVLSEKTVTYQELAAGELADGTDIAILGDGTTHYYHQGMVSVDNADDATEETLRWDKTESNNNLEDMGALKGTNLKDLCDLVGGMEDGETVKIIASDNFKKTFAYKNVYQYSSKEGPMVICWWKDGAYPDGTYTKGMRLVWFADASTNPWGYHVFGNWDWHEAADSSYWYYYYQSATERYPTTTGLSVQNVAGITIYSNDPAPAVAAFSADKTSGGIPLTVNFTDASTGTPTAWAWDFNNDGTTDSTLQNPSYQYTAAGIYTVKLTVTNAAGSDDEVKTEYINAGCADFPLQLIGASTVSMSKTDMAALLNTTNTYTDGNGNIFEGVPLWKLIALVDDGDPTTLNTGLLGTYNIVFTGLNQDGTDYPITITAGNWSTYFTDGNIQTSDLFIATKVKIKDTSEFIDLPAVSVNKATKNWRPAILNGSAIITSGTRVGGLYKIQLTGLTAEPVAAFTASATSGTAPLTVNFTDQSTGSPTSWAWDFNNDGTTDSTSQNPSYQYATAGTYTVKLTVTNANGSDDEIKTNYITVNAASSMTVLYNGTVDLTPDATFTLTSYNGLTTDPKYTDHTVSATTPLGALQAAATAADFTYLTNDKKYTDSGILLLDNINTDTNDYNFVKSNYSWYVYVKKASSDTYTYLDDYNSPTTLGLNIYQLEDGDKVEFYYAYKPSNSNYATVTAIATAAVKTVVNTDTMTVLYNGTVDLTPDATFTLTSYNGATPPVNTQHTVSATTPLGALQAAATAADFTYLTNDKKYTDSGILLLDNINTDTNDYNFVKSNYSWYVYVKKAGTETYTYLDDYNSPTTLGLNIYQLEDGDKVEFYYAYKPSNSNYAIVTAIATAAVKTVVDLVGVTPDDWTLELSGAKTEDVTKAYFEQGLACQHEVTWTDGDGNIWGGVPLWLLVGMVDDNPDVGTKHFNFNDDLAAEHYEITVKSGDGWETTLDSADIARSSDYIVANTLNGEPLPELTDSETPKPCWPLILKGAGISGGQQVGNIVSIELSGLPDPDAGWTLDMQGEIGDTITQAEFEEGVECQHGVEWTDAAGKVWSGVPLWVLVGTVDDIENSSHWTFSDSVAAQGYTVKVYDEAGNYKTFTAAEIARNNNYIVANVYDGNPLTGDCPLRLVGSAVATDGVLGDNAIANIAMIELPELETPAAASGSYNLTVDGKISDVLSQAELEAAMACAQSGHNVTWTDADGKVWSGMPLWFLTGWVDDRVPHGYNYSQAQAGYTITVKAADGYSKQFDSADIANSSDYIIANMYDGAALDESIWPLRLVGDGVATDKVLNGNSISQIAEIKLTDFQTEDDIPQLHIVKYDTDGTTILSQVTIDYKYMEDNLDVYGDGTTVYKYEAVTFNPDDIWDEDGNYETYGYKISNAVKGTLIKDLVELVGGMGGGTDVKLVAKDGYETILPYDNIYTNPAVQAIQGDAILAWYADGKYVPYYDEGMRVFFLAPDKVYGQWDMHESLDSDYWHYYFSDNIQYPSCAGTSSKYITEIKVYSSPASDWELHLDGTDVGGDSYDISKTYFESAVACQLGSNHAETYTDGNGDEWTGLPLYFLAGYVDDENRHSDGAFNDTLASNGYNVILETGDGSLLVIDSKDMMNNRNIVVANTVNDVAIADDDADWPLKIVGSDIDDELSFGNIVSIRLENYCTVTFDKNTGDTEANPTTLTNPGGAVWTLPTEPTKAGYTFVGWNTAADGSGEDFNEETFVIDDITVYAQWQQTDKYSLTAVADDAYSSIVNNIGVVEFTAKKGGLVLFGVDVNAPYQAHAGKETVVFVHLRNGVQLSYNTTVADFDTVDGAQAGFDVQAGDVVKVYIVDSLTNSTASNPNYLQ